MIDKAHGKQPDSESSTFVSSESPALALSNNNNEILQNSVVID